MQEASNSKYVLLMYVIGNRINMIQSMLDHTDVYCISHFENVLILIVSTSQKRSTHLQNYDRLHILDGKAPCNSHDGKHLFPELKTVIR